MVVLVSLVTAAIFGAGDFCGGLAARRIRPVEVVAGSHAVGLVGAALAALAWGASFDLGDLALGAAGGVFGGIGVWLLYRRLAIGPMYVVAPLTAVTSAVVPSVWGFLIGERLGPAVIGGLVVALVAIALVSSSDRGRAEATVDVAVVVESLLAGAGFGAFFILLDATDAASAPWPVAGARLLTTTALGIALFSRRRAAVDGDPARAETGPGTGLRAGWWTDPGVVSLIVAVGVLDTAANIGFLWATTRGALAVASVLTSLYPVSTVILARLVLGERMNGRQVSGFALALAGSGLIAAG